MPKTNIDKSKEFILQYAYECQLFSDRALAGYNDFENIQTSIQFMNQAFQCYNQLYVFYLENFETKEIDCLDNFLHQFLLVNIEFLSSVESSHDLHNALNEHENLEEIYSELKNYLNA